MQASQERPQKKDRPLANAILPVPATPHGAASKQTKVFCFFFSKKKSLSSSAARGLLS
jgi:hypothetical protein